MNSSARNFLKKISDRLFWGQHPEAVLRYLPVVREIKKRGLENSKILEIGSGSLGITPYFKKNIDGLDIDFTGSFSKYLRKIKGSAEKLPFADKSYDVTLSVDVLEHLDQKLRKQAVSEQLRVTKKLAIIVVPCGQMAEIQDRQLRIKWNHLFKKKNQYFEEHVKFGLPASESMLNFIDRAVSSLGRRAGIKTYSNLNLTVRKALMNLWISNIKLTYYLYLKGLLILVPILRFCNFGKTYRQVFVIEFAS